MLGINETKEFKPWNILLFLLITFTWTWLLWLPSVLSQTGHSNPILFLFFIIGGYGPFVGAFSLTLINESRNGVRALWKRFWNVKIAIKWVLISFLLFPVLYIISSVIDLLVQGNPPILAWISHPWVIINYLLIAFFAGGFSEEFGWRGYALDHFQVKFNALISSIIIGLIWGFWHLPVWFIAGDPHSIGGISDFFLFLLEVVSLSVLYTWLYNNTNRSILIAVILHTIYNFMTFFIILSSVGGDIYQILFYLTIILVVVFFKGEKN